MHQEFELNPPIPEALLQQQQEQELQQPVLGANSQVSTHSEAPQFDSQVAADDELNIEEEATDLVNEPAPEIRTEEQRREEAQKQVEERTAKKIEQATALAINSLTSISLTELQRLHDDD